MTKHPIIINEICHKCKFIKPKFGHSKVEVAHCAMARITYHSISLNNIFGMCLWITLNRIDLHHKTFQLKISTNNNGKYMLWTWNQPKQKDFQRTWTNHNKGKLKFKSKHEITKSKTKTWCVHNVISSNKKIYDKRWTHGKKNNSIKTIP